MKCPKCGYTSFESYDSCRKCSTDLLEFKQAHGLSALVLPPSLRASMAAGMDNPQTETSAASENGGDMFSFDLPTEQQTAAPASAASSDPFSFDDAPAAAPAFSFDTPPATPREDPFASLLDSAPKPQNPQASNQPAPAQGNELDNFSWDDTPTPGQPGSAPAPTAKTADDDFNSLFADLGGSNTK